MLTTVVLGLAGCPLCTQTHSKKDPLCCCQLCVPGGYLENPRLPWLRRRLAFGKEETAFCKEEGFKCLRASVAWCAQQAVICGGGATNMGIDTAEQWMLGNSTKGGMVATTLRCRCAYLSFTAGDFGV